MTTCKLPGPCKIQDEGHDLALQTIVTQQYDSLWYPSASGQMVRKEIHTAGGESGWSIVGPAPLPLRQPLLRRKRRCGREGGS